MSFYDPRQPLFETGLSDFDHRHRLVASYVWDLPRFTGISNSIVRSVLGGWEWSGIYTITSGGPLTLLAGTDRSKTNLGGDRVDYIGPASQFGGVAPESQRQGCRATEKHCVPWLNTLLFAAPATGQYGNVGKGSFTGPGRWNFDMGVLRNFIPMSSHENIRLQFRGEFFNVFNHTELNDPTVSLGANFGGIRAAADPRIIQLGAKMFF